MTRVITPFLSFSPFSTYSVILDDSLGCLTCRDWSRKGSPASTTDPFQPFRLFLSFLGEGGCTEISFKSQNLVNELPELGGTNPYPLAPTTTPLVSAVLGGGPGGNNTGPTKGETRIKTKRILVIQP